MTEFTRGGLVATTTPASPPVIRAVGAVQVVADRPVVNVEAGATSGPTVVWMVAGPRGERIEIPEGVSSVPVRRLVRGRGVVVAYLFDTASGWISEPIRVPVAVAPGAAAPLSPPVLTGTLTDRTLIVGEVVTIDASSFVTGSRLRYEATLNGAALPAGWVLTGSVVTVPTAAPYAAATLRIRIFNEAGEVFLTSVISCQAAGPATLQNTTPPTFSRLSGPAGAEVGAVWRVGGAAWSGGVAPFTSENRIFRNGVVTRDWTGGNGEYTILEADRGATLTASVRRRDSTTPTPQEVIIAATGSAVVPSSAVVGTVVSTSSALATALQNSVAGDVILLAPGTYSPLSTGYQKGTATTGTVTVKSQVQGNPARFPTGLGTAGHRGIIFDNLILGPETPPAGDRTVVGVGGVHNRVTFRNLLVRDCFNGIALTGGGTNVVIEACEVVRWQNDGLRLWNGFRGALVRNNLFEDPRPNTGPDHADVFQMAQNDAGGFHEDVTIEDNIFKGTNLIRRTQGLLHRSGWLYGTGLNPIPGVTPTIIPHPADYASGGSWKRFRIRRNYIEVNHTHGIYLSGHTNVECNGNLLRTITNVGSDDGLKPGITLEGSNAGRVWNNVQAKSFIFVTPAGQFPGRTSDFSEFGVTFLASFADATVPVGWVMPTAGRGALGW
jgi:hypothetical protein